MPESDLLKFIQPVLTKEEAMIVVASISGLGGLAFDAPESVVKLAMQDAFDKYNALGPAGVNTLLEKLDKLLVKQWPEIKVIREQVTVNFDR